MTPHNSPPQAQLRTFALTQLNGIVDEFWAEVSGSIDKMCG